MKKRKVSVCGCSLVDNLFPDIDFHSEAFQKFLSRRDGDGGIAPGRLVFAEDLEQYCSMPYDEIRSSFSETGPALRNLGGPAVVGAVGASQLLQGKGVEFLFHGYRGDDESGEFIASILEQTPLNTEHYRSVPGPTPVTDVLSDPRYHDGKGERSFVNRVGISQEFGPEQLPDSFFKSDFLWFAATALVPKLHDDLDRLLARGRREGRITIVSTVFDFRNEKKDPVGPWPLGKDSAEAYRNTDLLIVDWEEALRMSGAKKLDAAADFLIRSGVSSFFITHGAKQFYGWSDGRLFRETPLRAFPVSALVDEDLARHPEKRGDTTGCGDNFAGALVASLVSQLAVDGVAPGEADPLEAAAWAAAAGGAACFHIGGTCLEKHPGERLAVIRRYVDAYLKDVHSC